MTTTFRLADRFARFAAGGEEARAFREIHIDPRIARGETVELDFDGIRGTNTGFCCGLFANLVAERGPAVLEQLRFVNCNPLVREMIDFSLQLRLAPPAADAYAPRPAGAA